MSQANHNSEYRQIKRKSGKWSKPGVPHKGWTCTGFEDLGGSNEVCGMCEFQLIRYIHYMKHPEYPEVIAAGCVCAGQMERDYGAARNREKSMRDTARRRSKWLERKWKTSSNGNEYINTRNGYHVVVYPTRKNKGGRTIKSTNNNRKIRLLWGHKTPDEVQVAAFDAIEKRKKSS